MTRCIKNKMFPNNLKKKPVIYVITCVIFYASLYYVCLASRPNPIGLRTGLASSYFVPGFVEPSRNVCAGLGASVKLLILVNSSPSNFMSRMAIRATWGRQTNKNDTVAVAFVMGVCETSELQESVQRENNVYSDIVQAKFLESYYNLTLKTMSMMLWTADYCPEAKFVLKVDDDMYINTPKLLKFVDQHYDEAYTMFGRLMEATEPVRDPSSKYYTSLEEYAPKYFPDFLTGGAYLLPGALAPLLHNKSLEMPFLKLEDAFLTGLVADSLRVKRVNAPEFSNLLVTKDACNVQRLISIHDVKPIELLDVWNKLFGPNGKCKIVLEN